MKEPIEHKLNDLTPEQIDTLISQCNKTRIPRRIKKRIQRRVLSVVREKEGKTSPLFFLSACIRKLAAVAAAFVVVGGAVLAVGFSAGAENLPDAVFEGFQTIAVSVRSLFTYTPGVGITEVTIPSDSCEQTTDISDSISFLTYESTIDTIPAQDGSECKARLVRTHYADGKLNLVIECDYRQIFGEAFTLYVNGERYGRGDEGFATFDYQFHNSTGTSEYYYTVVNLSYVMPQPKIGDVFEIEINGYIGCLSVSPVLYTCIEELEAIGPTVEKNGISLTVTSEWVDGWLVVWTTPFIRDETITDTIMNYGRPAKDLNFRFYSGIWNQLQVFGDDEKRKEKLEAELAECIPNVNILAPDWRVPERLHQYTPQYSIACAIGYDRYGLIPPDISEVKYTIPFLAMRRQEAHSLEIPLPTEQGIFDTDYVIATSLGNIRITSITRKSESREYDKVTCKIELESLNEKEYFQNFTYSVECDRDSYIWGASSNPKSARLESFRVSVAKDEDSMTLNISSLDYFLMDEYSFDLDISRPIE